jgi:hypothetical protein
MLKGLIHQEERTCLNEHTFSSKAFRHKWPIKLTELRRGILET